MSLTTNKQHEAGASASSSWAIPLAAAVGAAVALVAVAIVYYRSEGQHSKRGQALDSEFDYSGL